MGKSQPFVENVPHYVDKVSLTAWLTAGMRSNVTRIKKMRERVADAKKKLKQVEAQLKDVPFIWSMRSQKRMHSSSANRWPSFSFPENRYGRKS